MFNIGPGELMAIAAVALIVLGPQRLPEALRSVGRVVGELRRVSGGFQDELRRAIEDADLPEPELRTTTLADPIPGDEPIQEPEPDEPGYMQLPTDLPEDDTAPERQEAGEIDEIDEVHEAAGTRAEPRPAGDEVELGSAGDDDERAAS